MEVEDQAGSNPLHTTLVVVAGVLGLLLILLGLWALGGAIYFAWTLFRNPDAIAYFAHYFLETTKIAAYLNSGGEGLAHYVSWVAVVVLLLVMGKLGAWAVQAGALLISARRF